MDSDHDSREGGLDPTGQVRELLVFVLPDQLAACGLPMLLEADTGAC